MIPFLHTDALGRGSVRYVTFGQNNAWFARYSSNVCIWGPTIEAFPKTFQDVVTALEKTPRKDEAIDFVSFGMHELLLLRFENGNAKLILSDDPAVQARCSQTLIADVNKKLEEGWTIGNRTSLCPYDPEAYFIEWKRGTVATFSFNLGPGRQEELARVKNVLDGVGNDAYAVAKVQNAQLVSFSEG